MKPAGRVDDWLQALRAASGLQVQRIPLDRCRGWTLRDGALRHETGRYFSVVGTRCRGGHPGVDGLAGPMVDQPEVGILGFLVQVGDGAPRWLLQGKTEPGNVQGTQVGPTVQATWSNYMRVHGGRPTALLEYFRSPAEPSARVVADTLQSEQGDRFIGKHNRNMVVRVDAAPAGAERDTLRWFDAARLREALLTDFAVNTDARSVLCCGDWALLSDSAHAPPFARWRGCGGFGEALWASRSRDDDAAVAALRVALDAAAAQPRLHLERCALEAVQGWHVDAWSIAPDRPDGQHEIQAFDVQTRDREITAWCQPLMVATRRERVVLACCRQDGVLRFLARASLEPGFRGAWQLGPSMQTGTGHRGWTALEAALDAPGARRHASVLQSDEGGRFGQSVARYEIVELDTAPELGEGPAGHWLSLATLQRLAAQPARLTNELRSALSLLLAWA